MNLRSLNSSSMQGASFDREIASGFARKAISQDGEAVRSDSSAVAVDDAQVARTTSAPVVLRVGFKAGKMTAGKHGEDPEVSEAVRRLQKSRLGYRFTKRAFDINGGGGSTESSERARRLKEELGSVPVTGIEDRVAYRFLKRAFDIVFSAAVLIVFCWLYVIIAVLIKVDDPKAPVFFSQERVGKDGRTFRMLKFRSMCVDSEKNGARLASKHDSRITPVGHVLRNLHLDELPQLFNVFKGDMSLVGPRPERESIMLEYEKELPEFYYRLKVKAGLTGYAQVYGKYNTTPYDKLKLDLFYIENYSVWLDLKLMLLTLKILFTPDSTEGVDEKQVTAMKKQVQEEEK